MDGHADLYWIPLGAGANVVRVSGKLFEVVAATVGRRPRCDIYHSALVVVVPDGRYVIEMTPVPRSVDDRGVVAEGAVGTRWAGRLRIFRYEIRRWRGGSIPDATAAVDSPVRVADDLDHARRILDLVPSVPTPVWGRHELVAGDMWNSNSVVSWVLTRSGVDLDGLGPPPGGRAPGWDAGVVVAGCTDGGPGQDPGGRYGSEMTEPVDERERHDLCDLLVELGPDAPTLCEGWTTADMAAHLVLREHFHRWGDERMAAEKAKGYDVNIERLRAGAPLVPWRIPGVRTLLNGGEYLIHHEDVRRANGLGPRTGRPDLDEVAWRMAAFTGRRLARKLKPSGLELQRADGESKHFGGDASVVLTGSATDLALFLSGRREAAEVEVGGDPDAVTRLEQVQLGL